MHLSSCSIFCAGECRSHDVAYRAAPIAAPIAAAAAAGAEAPAAGAIKEQDRDRPRPSWFYLLSRALWLGFVLLPPLLLLLPWVLAQSCCPAPATDENHGRLRSWLAARCCSAFEGALLRGLQRGSACCIKFGQWASTRPDVLPPSLCSALSNLHSGVPAHSLAATRAALAAEFGEEAVARRFRWLSPAPIGSGCIAQVHEAIGSDGSRYAVKVLHPEVSAAVHADLCLLGMAARLLERLVLMPGMRYLALPEAVDSFADFMLAQLDLQAEAANLERFIDDFANEPETRRIAFPQPVPGLVSKSVLVETFIEGEPISYMLIEEGPRAVATSASEAQALTERNRRLARHGLSAFMAMVLNHNFVHGDLHPGNILVAPNWDHERAGYKLSFVDAGLVVELSERDRRNFLLLFHAIGHGDGARVAQLMLEGSPQQRCDRPDEFRAGMAALVARAFDRNGAFNLHALRISDVLMEVMGLVRTHHVQVDPTFTTLVLSISVLEGLGRQLDPQLDIFSIALPMMLPHLGWLGLAATAKVMQGQGG